MLPPLLNALTFRSKNAAHRPLVDALVLLAAYANSSCRFYDASDHVPLDAVVPAEWRDAVVDERGRIERIPYELCVLRALRDGLRRHEIWVEGAGAWRNPDHDLPADFDAHRDLSQLKTCSSSEVAAMIEGVLRHSTDADIDRNYVDSHGQSAVGFAFTELLGFRLLPRLKNIASQRLYRPDDQVAWPHLPRILTRPIRLDLVAQQYDQMVKYATALRLGTADAEAILRRFPLPGPHPPSYAALV